MAPAKDGDKGDVRHACDRVARVNINSRES
jgi:hypothetical protein